MNDKISFESLSAFRYWMHHVALVKARQKGSDYNKTQQDEGDTLFNLRVAEILGLVPTAERGVLVRLSDKFMRIISLLKPGVKPACEDESVIDTVVDIHNYSDYALLLHLEREDVDWREMARVFYRKHEKEIPRNQMEYGGYEPSKIEIKVDQSSLTCGCGHFKDQHDNQDKCRYTGCGCSNFYLRPGNPPA